MGAHLVAGVNSTQKTGVGSNGRDMARKDSLGVIPDSRSGRQDQGAPGAPLSVDPDWRV
jgi:hypothetical protein